MRHGWSIGDLRITIGGQIITQQERGAARQNFVSWYLLPVFEWLADHWTALLHETEFAWPEKSAAPAAIACNRSLAYWIGAEDRAGRAAYYATREWWTRHALRAHSSGGLFPDLLVRRYLDDIELSWSGSEPLFAPEGFHFVATAGAVYLPVDEVATPLWEALNWAVRHHSAELDDDIAVVQELAAKIEGLRAATVLDLSAGLLSQGIRRKIGIESERIGRELIVGRMVNNVPAVAEFSPAVAMFGGVSPELEQRDVNRLADFLVGLRGKSDSARLVQLLDGHQGPPAWAPHIEGYRLAEQVLDELGLIGNETSVDVRCIADSLNVSVKEAVLDTDTIRGVALAGEDIGPAIFVNLSSYYNSDEEGRRFTIAHELCHILYDRTHARHVGITSGPWAPPGIEKRANAFGAMLLMPRQLVLKALPMDERPFAREVINRAATTLRVNESALVEHLYNLDLIDEIDRDRLRTAFRH
jgi:Zn-dependent peptidase ImmA (M78 family)